MEAPDTDSGGESDPRTVVGLTTSSRTPIHNPDITVLLDPTRDLNLIFDSFQRIVRGGKFDMIEAIVNCLAVLPFPFSDPPEKRIVMFAGGIISMPVEVADEFGTCLKKKGIAFDIVNFTLGDELGLRKKKLEAFVAAVNNNDNSHIIHVDDGSSLSNLLSSFMAGDEHVEAKGMKNKDHQLKTKNQKKAKEIVNVKRELEPSRKGTAYHKHMENGKNVPLKLLNRFEAFSISTE